MTIARRSPDFFIVGAAKSGTTSLYHHLTQHPSIYMPAVKEPNFLAYWNAELDLRGPVRPQRLWQILHDQTVLDEARYFALFDAARPDQCVGEASPRYLYYPNAVTNIARITPQAKLIVLLRDPVLRAHSHFRMNREFDLEPCRNFEAALAEEDARCAEGYGWDWHYLRVSRYGEQLRRLRDHFAPEQLYVATFERLMRDGAGVCREICRFLGVDEDFTFDFSERHKVSQAAGGWLGASLNHTELSPAATLARALLPRAVARPIKQGLLAWVERRAAAEQQLQAQTYQRMRAVLADDIAMIQKLVPVDLGGWVSNERRYAAAG